MKKVKKGIDIKNKKVVINDELGVSKEYDIVAVVNTEDGKYLVYTSNKTLKSGEILLYINSIVEERGKLYLDLVTDEETIKVTEKLKERIENAK